MIPITDEYYRKYVVDPGNKTLAANIVYRKRIETSALANPKLRDDLWVACSRDTLFWINTYAWIFEPRDRRVMPFVTYGYQDEAIMEMEDAIDNQHDIVFDKSRDVGATWMALSVFKHRFDLHPMSTFMVASRKEDYVDKTGDPDCLFWKLDFLHQHLPKWLKPPIRPKVDRIENHIGNPLNGSTIDGAATTGDIGRGGRRLAIFIDEFPAFPIQAAREALPATQKNTRSRIFAWTPNGAGHPSYGMVHPPPGQPSIKRISLHWSDHPIQRRGIYQYKRGQLELKDDFWQMGTVKEARKLGTEVQWPKCDDNDLANDLYPFILDGKLRSPYYDSECIRSGGVESIIAQELDISYLGSGSPVLGPHEVDAIIERDALPPLHVGELLFNPDSLIPIAFDENPMGHLKLWFPLTAQGGPPLDRAYFMGTDIAVGTNASNSAHEIGDGQTREKVAEFASNTIDSTDLAEYGVALARWFGDAHIIWEANGEGQSYGNRVIRYGYENIFYRQSEDSMKKTISNIPGWWSSKKSKKLLLTEAIIALKSGEMTDRSEQAIVEFGQYEYFGEGVEHNASLLAARAAERGENHGDRAIATALLWRIMRDVPKEEALPTTAPPGSFKQFFDEAKQELATVEDELWS